MSCFFLSDSVQNLYDLAMNALQVGLIFLGQLQKGSEPFQTGLMSLLPYIIAYVR